MAKVDMFRPYMTAKEISTIIKLCTEYLIRDSHTENAAVVAELRKKLRVFEFKISEGMVTANLQRKENASESIGAIKDSNSKPENEFQLRFDTLAEKVISGTITEEEKQEGKRLEMMLYKMELGTFA